MSPFVLFLFACKIFLVETAGGELGASASAVGAHRLESADEFGALRFNEANYLLHYCAGLCGCLHTEAAARHEHKLLRVDIHHMRYGRILGSLGAVVVILTVVSLALYEVCNADKMTAEMNRNEIRDSHFNAEIECSDRAMLTHKQLMSPLGGGELGAGLTYCVKGTELTEHPILFGGIF